MLYWYGFAEVDEGSTYLKTDVEAQISFRKETDSGMTFGASVDLETSTSDCCGGAVDDARVWVSGRLGTLSAGDFDGALDWAMREAHIGLTIDDTEKHLGWNGNSGLDGFNDGNILRYEYAWETIDLAVSVEPGTSSDRDAIWGIGARYTLNHEAGDVTFGVGYQQSQEPGWSKERVWGVSAAAEFYSGLEAILNYSEFTLENTRFDNSDWGYSHVGIALGYSFEDWTFSANWGRFDGDGDGPWFDDNYDGIALVANYDLGAGAEIQAGYAFGNIDQFFSQESYDHWSLGISMSF